MTKTVEIYFDDLKTAAQEYLLMTWDTSKGDENWDTFPMAVIEREVEEPYPWGGGGHGGGGSNPGGRIGGNILGMLN